MSTNTTDRAGPWSPASRAVTAAGSVSDGAEEAGGAAAAGTVDSLMAQSASLSASAALAAA